MTPALVLAAQKKRELVLRAQRPCTLLWDDGVPHSVAAREGVSQQELDMIPGGAVDRLSCKFYVLRELLPAAPEVGTVFRLASREDERWRLQKILAGRSPNDVVWIFQCVEEDA